MTHPQEGTQLMSLDYNTSDPQVIPTVVAADTPTLADVTDGTPPALEATVEALKGALAAIAARVASLEESHGWLKDAADESKRAAVIAEAGLDEMDRARALEAAGL